MAAKNGNADVEEKKLTEVQKFRLLNVHLQDRILILERELANQIQQLGGLREQNAELRRQVHEVESKKLFDELGIGRGDAIQLSDDGSLTIRKAPAKAPGIDVAKELDKVALGSEGE